MSFWHSLAQEAWKARTPWLLLGLALTFILIRRLPLSERPRLRPQVYLVSAHVAMLIAAAVMDATGYVARPVQVAALAFELFALVGLGSVVAFRIVLPAVGLGVPRILVDILTAIAVVVALIVVGQRAGFSVAGLITTSAVLTAVIGFSMQDTLGNMMGGLALQMDNSVKAGDWITMGPGQPAGRITEIRWRYTALETRNWETIVIPNSLLMKNAVTVLGRRTAMPLLWRRTVEFNVDFRTPPTDVIDVISEALRADPPERMAEAPGPLVLFFGLRDSYAVYCVRYWLNDLDADEGADSDVRIRVYFALRRAGIPMSIPAQAVFVTEDNAERELRKEQEEQTRRLEALGRVDLFRVLTDDLRKQLAAQLRFAPFARGEAITREGERDDGLYMIVEGEAAVRIGEGPAAREVARLTPGQFFGEMSLMTGERRSATVVALSDLTCYRVDKPAFELMLREHPAIAEEVAELLAERREALAAVRDEIDETRQKRLATAKHDLLGRIRGFFGMGES